MSAITGRVLVIDVASTALAVLQRKRHRDKHRQAAEAFQWPRTAVFELADGGERRVFTLPPGLRVPSAEIAPGIALRSCDAREARNGCKTTDRSDRSVAPAPQFVLSRFALAADAPEKPGGIDPPADVLDASAVVENDASGPPGGATPDHETIPNTTELASESMAQAQQDLDEIYAELIGDPDAARGKVLRFPSSPSVPPGTEVSPPARDCTNKKLEAALDLAARGFAVFPLKPYVDPGPNATPETKKAAINRAKEPLLAGWQRLATTDPERIKKCWSEDPERNIGVLTEDYVVVDIDPRNGGDATFKEMSLCSDFPETTKTVTWSGGSHVIYALPPGVKVKGGVELLGPGVDIKSWGGYVVGAGSTIDGKTYTWANERPVAPAPAWLIERCGAARQRTDAAGKRLVEEDETAIAMARDWMERQPAVEVGQIDDTEFKMAARCYDFGCSVDTVEELLTEWFMRHDIPTSPERLKVIARSAGVNRDNAIGARHPSASGFEPVEIAPREELNGSPQGTGTSAQDGADRTSTSPEQPPQPEPQKSLAHLKPISFGELDKRPQKPIEELIPGLIEKHTVTFLSAPGASHKSRVAVHWGRSLHHGLPVYGRQTQQATFVYVSCEDDIDEVTTRAQTLKRRLDLPEYDTGLYWNLVGEDAPLAVVEESGACKTQPFWDILVRALLAVPGHKFVVFDGTYNMLRFAGQAKINETSVLAGINLLTRFCHETDSTVLTLWHPSQAGQERGDASGWSVAWHNVPRARLSLTAIKDQSDAYELRVEKRNHGPKGPPIALYWDDGLMLPRTEIAEENISRRMHDAIVAVAVKAAEKGVPFTKQRNATKSEAEEICMQAGGQWRPAPREIKECLLDAVREGRLVYLGAGNANASLSKRQRRPAGYYPPDQEQQPTMQQNTEVRWVAITHQTKSQNLPGKEP